jgi:hypothetical protein
VNSLAPAAPTVNSKPDVYRQKAIATRKRRAEAAKIADALYQERRAAFRAELDAIVAANAAKVGA